VVNTSDSRDGRSSNAGQKNLKSDSWAALIISWYSVRSLFDITLYFMDDRDPYVRSGSIEDFFSYLAFTALYVWAWGYIIFRLKKNSMSLWWYFFHLPAPVMQEQCQKIQTVNIIMLQKKDDILRIRESLALNQRQIHIPDQRPSRVLIRRQRNFRNCRKCLPGLHGGLFVSGLHQAI